MTRLQTERLTIEPVTPENAAILWRVMQSPSLREFQDVPRFTRDEFQRRVERRPTRLHARASGRFEWLIYRLRPRVAVGWVSMRLGEHAPGAGEVGYTLLAPHRGQGFATEAVRALADSVFATSDIARIEACCIPENAASRRLLSRLGFAQTNVQRNGAVVRGRSVDVMVYEMRREQWKGYGGSANSMEIPASPKS